MNNQNIVYCQISCKIWRAVPWCMQMDELACFAPGMLALGSSGYGPGEAEKLLSLAEEVILK